MSPAFARAKALTGVGAQLLPRRLPGTGSNGLRLQAVLERLVEELEPGTLLPSERLLAERYGVARQTVRGEFDRLTRNGLVYRIPSHGTFVAESPLVLTGEVRSFSEDMRARGLKAGSRLLAQEVTTVHPLLASGTELEADAQAVRLKRIRTADGAPLALEEMFLPVDRFADLVEADLSTGSLFALLAERWGVEVRTAEHRVLAVSLTKEDADLLEVAPRQPGLLVRSVARDDARRLIHVGTSLYRSDRYEFLVRQQRT